MPTFLELASEANGFATSRPVTAASIPRRDYPLPRVFRSWDMRGFLGTRDRASCAIEALARMSFSKKSTRSRYPIFEISSSRSSRLQITCISRFLREGLLALSEKGYRLRTFFRQ